mmetsp:Transcript_20988/g.59534  ORF Transcript_20988/g.59534 Transcript_20988/m.59534 type:complete len:366 (+) Transcript_20988:112-1209(+)
MPRDAMRYLERLHNNLYNTVGDAVSRIAYIQSDWGPDEIVKRIVRFMYKACSDNELVRMPWEELCKEVVERGFQGYSAACSEMDWFYEIDLVPAFTQAAMELIGASGQHVHPPGVQEIVHAEYEDKLDRCMLDKAFWDVTSSVISDEKAAGKLRGALTKAYWPALDEVLNDGSLPREMLYGLDQASELRRVESFTRKWLDDALSRSWQALENVGETPSEELVMDMLKQLIAPFGTSNPFSCLPAALTEGLGRPPPDWAFIRTISRELIASMTGGQVGAPAAKKRKKGKKAGESAYQEEEDAEAGGGAFSGTGHPRCTSADDCIGNATSTLIRHLHNNKPGDTYCQPCWDSFCERNPTLKGVVEEG